MKVTAINPKFDGMVPHLMLRTGDISEIVLLPGDPARVLMFENLCDDYNIIATNREYTIGKGYYKNIPITVCSTGIGGPSTEIAVLELIELGAKALIRIGGTGALFEEINCGDMIINTGAMRLGGATNFYAPPEYPAVASYEVIDSLIRACKDKNTAYWTGLSSSIGSFFAGQGRPILGKAFHDEKIIENYRKLNILNMEMESETIMTLASIFNVYSGCICAVHANRETDEWLYDFKQAQEEMCKIALEASVYLYNNYLQDN